MPQKDAKKEDDFTLVIKYHRFWGYSFIGLFILCAGLYILLWQLNGQVDTSKFVPIGLGLVLGVMYLTMDYAMVTENEIRLFSLFGLVAKRYSYEFKEDLFFIGSRLYLHQDGKKKKIRLSKTMARNSDWKRLEDYVTRNDITQQIHE